MIYLYFTIIQSTTMTSNTNIESGLETINTVKHSATIQSRPNLAALKQELILTLHSHKWNRVTNCDVGPNLHNFRWFKQRTNAVQNCNSPMFTITASAIQRPSLFHQKNALTTLTPTKPLTDSGRTCKPTLKHSKKTFQSVVNELAHPTKHYQRSVLNFVP